MNYFSIRNNESVSLINIPELDYENFFKVNLDLINQGTFNHCVTYFGFITNNKIKLISCIANDNEGIIYVSSTNVSNTDKLQSLSSKYLGFEKFEREIHENFGVEFIGHPWLKPVRYPFDRHDKGKTISNYPFYEIESEELHEVGVGPIHAGIIEPGHFRFICNGEQILHLEIQLGYQHRGIEKLFFEKTRQIERITLAENIAGDTVIGHSTAHCYLMESISDFNSNDELNFVRTLALELERIAVHTGDLSAACADIAYQLGASVFGRLRTPIINFLQEWCGNRLGKGLIRPGNNNFGFSELLGQKLLSIIDKFEPEFNEMCNELFTLPSAISRFERTGIFTTEQAVSIGAVGMAARSSGLIRDIRKSHSYGYYNILQHEPIVKRHGDVYSRVQLRKHEVRQSIIYLKKLLQNIPAHNTERKLLNKFNPDTFGISLVEGWRGEICHCAITDSKGNLTTYKVKDPSFHNWLALALAVRNNEISDFPICNKSFNLSYCGNDL